MFISFVLIQVKRTKEKIKTPTGQFHLTLYTFSAMISLSFAISLSYNSLWNFIRSIRISC
ncbi:MAG: hypothetical protein J7K51_00950 [Thermotogae bacterium]|nr:hypothetical protein [Thermotogota bacterium]